MDIGRPAPATSAQARTSGGLKPVAGQHPQLQPLDRTTGSVPCHDALRTKPAGKARTFQTLDLASPAPPGREIRFAIRNQLVHDPDRTNNACGANSLYSVMAHHLGVTRVSFAKLDAAVRAQTMDWGASPRSLTAYARSQGLATSLHLRGDAKTLATMVDAGLPVIVLVNSKEGKGDTAAAKKGSLHYVVVTGYQGKCMPPDAWIVHDPWPNDDNNRNTYGDREVIPHDAFMAKWTNIRLEGADTPLERLMITVAPKGKQAILPSDNADWAEVTAMGASDALTWIGEQLGKL